MFDYISISFFTFALFMVNDSAILLKCREILVRYKASNIFISIYCNYEQFLGETCFIDVLNIQISLEISKSVVIENLSCLQPKRQNRNIIVQEIIALHFDI